MKILLYAEGSKALSISGIGRALKHQQKALAHVGVSYTNNPKDTYDLAHINTIFYNSEHILKKCKRKNIPVIVHGHSTKEDFLNSFRFYKFISPWFNRRLIKMYKKADLIVTPTEYSKRLIDNYKTGTKVVVLSNGIVLSDYAHDEKKIMAFKQFFKINDGEKVIIGIGLLFVRKGIHDFFEIARSFPNIKFIWFGHLQRALTSIRVRQAIRNKPNNVVMPGYIDSDIIKGAFQYSECLLFPSYEETEGIVVLEALASRCPVICRDIGVYQRWLIDGKNCLKAKNNDEFIKKIKYVIKKDVSSLCDEGYEIVKTKAIENIGKELHKIYQDLVL
jgi:1,2-diacylglycerol-3-alpha-glucose alpha-1,2-glucosyltransferase